MYKAQRELRAKQYLPREEWEEGDWGGSGRKKHERKDILGRGEALSKARKPATSYPVVRAHSWSAWSTGCRLCRSLDFTLQAVVNL